MHDLIQFLIRHGYAVLFVAVFAEQTGFPLPAAAALLAAGALAGEGRFSLPLALLVAVLASLLADSIWYDLGRRRGFGVLRVICRISLNADTCVGHAKDFFIRYGPRVLLFAKFVPGLSAVATPMAGLLRMNPRRFLLLDGAGAALWAGTYCVLGFVFHRQIEEIAALAARTGASLLAALVVLFAVYLAWKWIQRRSYVRQLRSQRVSPEDLHSRLLAGEVLTVIDLRHAVEFLSEGAKVPGALHIPPEDLDNRHQEIPRDRDIILYCT
jgi:membrane protein DedA with SNARE-associated domain